MLVVVLEMGLEVVDGGSHSRVPPICKSLSSLVNRMWGNTAGQILRSCTGSMLRKTIRIHLNHLAAEHGRVASWVSLMYQRTDI